MQASVIYLKGPWGFWDVPYALWWPFRCLPGAPAWSLGPAQLCTLPRKLRTCSSPPQSSDEANDMELLLEDPACHRKSPKNRIPFLIMYISHRSGRKYEIVPLPGDLYDPGIEPVSLAFPALAGILVNTGPPWQLSPNVTQSLIISIETLCFVLFHVPGSQPIFPACCELGVSTVIILFNFYSSPRQC